MLPINLLFSAGKTLFSAWNGHRQAKKAAVKANELAELSAGKQVKTGWQVAFDTLVFSTVFGPFILSLYAYLMNNLILVDKMSAYIEHISKINGSCVSVGGKISD